MPFGSLSPSLCEPKSRSLQSIGSPYLTTKQYSEHNSSCLISMDRKASFSSSRRGSAVPSIASSISTGSSMAPVDPKIKVFSPDGTDRSCEITMEYGRAAVTLKEPGQPLETPGRYPRMLIRDIGSGEPANKDRMHHWHCSIINASDRDPTGRRNSGQNLTQESVDPGRLLDIYQHHLDYLEVLTGTDTSGKWMLRPIAVEKRQAIFNAKQAAKANSKQAQVDQALSFLKLAEEEERLQKARLERQARKAAKAEEAALRKQAATTNRRQNSNTSLGSTHKNKGARVSVSSLTSTQTTSTTLPRYSTNDPRAPVQQKPNRSLRQKLFHKKASS